MRDRDRFHEVMAERRAKKEEVTAAPAKFRCSQRVEASDFEDDPAALEEFVREQARGEFSADTVLSGVDRASPEVMERPETIDDRLGLVTEEGRASDTAMAIGALLGKGDLKTQTELDKEEVRALSVLLEVSQKFGAARLDEFARNFMALMVSHKRGSRREVVASFAGLDQYGRRTEPVPGIAGGLRPPHL